MIESRSKPPKSSVFSGKNISDQRIARIIGIEFRKTPRQRSQDRFQLQCRIPTVVQHLAIDTAELVYVSVEDSRYEVDTRSHHRVHVWIDNIQHVQTAAVNSVLVASQSRSPVAQVISNTLKSLETVYGCEVELNSLDLFLDTPACKATFW